MALYSERSLYTRTPKESPRIIIRDIALKVLNQTSTKRIRS